MRFQAAINSEEGVPVRDDDQVCNPSDNETFADVLAARLSRRSVLKGGAGAVALLSLGGINSLLWPNAAAAKKKGPLLGFSAIPVSTADTVVVPPGYTARVLIAWGDPISDGPAFEQNASNTSEDQEQQWGMHNDGLVYFPIQHSKRGLLVQNHEYTDDGLLFTDGVDNWSSEKTRKSLAAQGVSVIEIEKRGNGHNNGKGSNAEWRVVRPSSYARRVSGLTPITIGGPAAGDPLLRTQADPNGTEVIGTFNNCAMGFTPWGTYLTCEENFNGYFFKADLNTRTNLEKRYGISPSNSGTRYYTTDERFDADKHPNEPNRFGWVVEIDPFDSAAKPVKRTALGRLKHEGAWVQETKTGKIVVYMGDDERNEYLYRYVSNEPWQDAIANGNSPLDDGILYVAKFHADGTGEWLPLTPDNPALAGKSLSDILINARAAADAVGATMLDRPEWVDTLPETLTGIVSLTNNNRRGTNPPSVNNPDGSTTAGTARPPVDAPNPRADNVYGHILTWTYTVDFDGPTFTWDIYVKAGDPDALVVDGSDIDGDKFGSPDGIYVAPSGRLWIQTDVSTSTINAGRYAGFGNNQMLCSDPETREIRRFLVGPNQCEITGAFLTPDETTMFVGIQHPGETADESPNLPSDPKKFSSWPDGTDGGRPRSACIVITKDDGAEIGT